jgi:hypothetical protein
MKEIVELKLASGEVVYVEAEATSGPGARPASRRDSSVFKGVGDKVERSFETALGAVKPAARALMEAFKDLNEPDELGLEFGVQFKTEVDAFVLTGEANAAVKISLKWKNSKE